MQTVRANGATTRSICAAANAPIDTFDVNYAYGRGSQYGVGVVSVTVATTLNVSVSANPSTTINPNGTTQLIASPSGGVAPFSYSWEPPAGLSDPTNRVTDASPAATTTYVVTVTDDLGQTASNTITINVNTQLNVTANPPAIDVGQFSTLNATAIGGGGNYTYSWTAHPTLTGDLTNANVLATPSNTMTYTVHATDAAGVVLTGTVQVIVNLSVIATVVDDTINTGDSTQLVATVLGGDGNTTYTWEPAVTLDDPSAPDPMATPPATTTYIVRVLDGQGFMAEHSVVVNVSTIVVDPPPTASFTFFTQCCPNILNLDASGSTGNIVNYVWNLSWTSANPDATTVSPTLAIPISEAAFGTITLTVEAADGQTATYSLGYP